MVKPNEIKPQPKQRAKKQEYYVIEKIVGKKTIKGKVYYRIRWHGFTPDDDTWEPREQLLKDAPSVVNRYDKTH